MQQQTAATLRSAKTLPGNDAVGLVNKQLQTLGVVRARGDLDLDALVLIELEFVIEHVLVKRVLEALISKVDQQLLELVLRVEVLKT